MTYAEYRATRETRTAALAEAKAKLAVARNGYSAATVARCAEDVDWCNARVRDLDRDFRRQERFDGAVGPRDFIAATD